MRKFLSSLVVLGALVGFVGCTSDKGNSNISGTVTDTGNTIAGVVLRSDSSIASFATVRMARVSDRTDSLAVPAFVEVQTNDSGAFEFDSSYMKLFAADSFQIAVIDTVAKEVYYLPRVDTASRKFEKITLEKAAIITTSLYYQDVSTATSTLSVGSHFMIYMPGTPFFQSVFAAQGQNQADSVSLLVPAGSWWLGFCPWDSQIVAKLEDSGIADTSIYRVWNVDLNVNSGEVINAGPFIWSTTASVDSLFKEPEEEGGRITGTVLCDSSKNCAGIEVQLITDLYGFRFVEGDSVAFEASAKTDSTGRWVLPAPKDVPYDSFRVEFRMVDGSSVVGSGLSRYVYASEVLGLEGSLDIGLSKLAKPANLTSWIRLVINEEDSTQSSNCMVNSVVLGIKGTSHFVRDVTCNEVDIYNIPAGEQVLMIYAGDPKVVSALQKAGIELSDFVVPIEITLTPGATQRQQGLTYTPPTLPSLE